MAIQVLNTDSDLTGKTLITAENSYSVGGLYTFNRAPGAPFAVQAGSANVPNLNAASLNGQTFTSPLITAPTFTGNSAFFNSVTTAAVGTQNNFAPGLSGYTVLFCSNASSLVITGFTGGYVGQRLIIMSIGAGLVSLNHLDAGSAVGNKLFNLATSAPTVLAAGSGAAEYEYDSSSRWRLVNHMQGDSVAWTPSFQFGGATTGITYGTQQGFYTLYHRVLFISVHLTLTSAGTATGAATLVTLPYTTRNVAGNFASFTSPTYANLTGAGGGVYGFVNANGVAVNLVTSAAGASTNLANTNFTNNSDVVFNGWYVVE